MLLFDKILKLIIMKEKKTKIYRSMCFKYGVITLCYLIEQYSEEENYEECQIILDAILQLSDKFNMKLPTKFDKNAFKWLKYELASINPNSDVDFYIETTPYYANKIKKEIDFILN